MTPINNIDGVNTTDVTPYCDPTRHDYLLFTNGTHQIRPEMVEYFERFIRILTIWRTRWVVPLIGYPSQWKEDPSDTSTAEFKHHRKITDKWMDSYEERLKIELTDNGIETTYQLERGLEQVKAEDGDLKLPGPLRFALTCVPPEEQTEYSLNLIQMLRRDELRVSYYPGSVYQTKSELYSVKR